MSKVSVLIPARNEPYLSKTIDDVLAKAEGDCEIIAVLDGFWPDPPLKERPNVITIHRSESRGMRDGITSAAAVASGTHLLKCDAHVMFAPGFDTALLADCDDDWVVVPRRHRLDPATWTLKDVGKPPIDAHLLSWPYAKPNELGMHGQVWDKRAKERADVLIDDEMSSQGSAWFTTKKHFERIGGLPEEGYGKFVQEFQQLGLKTWLSGGRVVVNKKTWYAHWHKGRENGRGYYISQKSMIVGTHFSAWYWLTNQWAERVHDIEWLIDKFSPVPTWPEDWREHVSDYVLGPNGLLQPAAPLAATGD